MTLDEQIAALETKARTTARQFLAAKDKGLRETLAQQFRAEVQEITDLEATQVRTPLDIV
ncbi:hypothetical protein ACGFZP_13090 [Kitasatospora sp. NPDC048239]|uniref:hypothetical protein n=1 Tax=Kitasatospora sp. NPDC048239 TaxID=3364046 RepID=UPI00371A5A8B